MPSTEKLALLLGVRYPIVQAPMAGVSTPELAAAVSNAGGLGSLGLGAGTEQQARAMIEATRALTPEPFNVNLFCHAPARADPQREAAWLAHLAAEFRQFGVEPPAALRNLYDTAVGNDRLLAMVLEARPKVVSFHFGLPDPHWVPALHAVGSVTLGCATNVDEAERLERAGIDAIVAQGFEAGGHRGVFDPAQDDRIGTLALVRLLARRCHVPIIAAGGIMDGQAIAAALTLGAAGAQMGTAFILCPESSASPAYREALRSEQARHTGVTSSISGRPARGIVNRLHALEHSSGRAGALVIPDYPIAYDAGKALHQAAAAQGSSDYAAHWAGQAAELVREMPAATLMATLVDEWRAASRHDGVLG